MKLLVVNVDKCVPGTTNRLDELGVDYILTEGPDVLPIQTVPDQADRRLTAACAALQGLLPRIREGAPFSIAARAAVLMADALLSELDK